MVVESVGTVVGLPRNTHRPHVRPTQDGDDTFDLELLVQPLERLEKWLAPYLEALSGGRLIPSKSGAPSLKLCFGFALVEIRVIVWVG